jgi:hypothetical protein
MTVIAVIARHRRNRKGKNLRRISADKRGSGKLNHKGHEETQRRIKIIAKIGKAKTYRGLARINADQESLTTKDTKKHKGGSKSSP